MTSKPDTFFSSGGNINCDDADDDTLKMKKKAAKQEEEKENKKRNVPLLKLFSFADSYDYVLMAIGSVGACVHGVSVPVFFIFFGKMINIIGLAYLFPKEASSKVGKVQ
jgi:ATP-binding cassette subfamily B (MDR/TAP) protein 1